MIRRCRPHPTICLSWRSSPDDGRTRARSAAWWDSRYRGGDIPWDTGIVPPEVVALVASGLLTPDWALDIGCGSGFNSRYLAWHGFKVVGVDLAQSALVRGSVLR